MLKCSSLSQSILGQAKTTRRSSRLAIRSRARYGETFCQTDSIETAAKRLISLILNHHAFTSTDHGPMSFGGF